MVKIGYKVLLAADVWTYTPRALTKFTGTPRSELVGADESIYTRLDRKATAIKGFDDLIPAIPVSGSYGEKIKNAIFRHTVVQVHASTSVSAGSVALISIQPASGETWELINSAIEIKTGAAGASFRSYIYDGVTQIRNIMSYEWSNTEAQGNGAPMIITNSLYSQLQIYNPDSVTKTAYYVYSAFKISSSPIHIERVVYVERNSNPVNPVPPSLPPPLGPLNRYAFICTDDMFKGKLCILLEEKVPLVKDEAGNVITHKLTYITLEKFQELFGDILADTAITKKLDAIRGRSVAQKMGWEKYVDKWKAEGIEF